MKKTFWAMILALLFTLLLATASADGSTPPAADISSDPYHAFVEWRNLQRSGTALELSYVYSSIDAGSSCVYIYSETEANKMCESVRGSITIEQWANNDWQYYTERGYYYLDAISATYSNTVSVEPRHYYRIVVYHEAMDDTDIVAMQLTTKSVYVSE